MEAYYKILRKFEAYTHEERADFLDAFVAKYAKEIRPGQLAKLLRNAEKERRLANANR